eukprot:TRINITY_DN19013_c0_g2_i3.p1 TRINITY_DN19013_c0_g2~~TRINITY_DN19013_c0_g2_i3.p1  ORF type:complete len:342 (-),score=28.24 TRINITY_DN19013_c0_g2_i3:267-1292(-)
MPAHAVASLAQISLSAGITPDAETPQASTPTPPGYLKYAGAAYDRSDRIAVGFPSSEFVAMAVLDVPGSFCSSFPAEWLASNFPDVKEFKDIRRGLATGFLDFPSLRVRLHSARYSISSGGVPVVGYALAFRLAGTSTLRFQGDGSWQELPREIITVDYRDTDEDTVRRQWESNVFKCRDEGMETSAFRIDTRLAFDVVFGNRDVQRGPLLEDAAGNRYPSRSCWREIRGADYRTGATIGEVTASPPNGTVGWVSFHWLRKFHNAYMTPTGNVRFRHSGPHPGDQTEVLSIGAALGMGGIIRALGLVLVQLRHWQTCSVDPAMKMTTNVTKPLSWFLAGDS